MYHHRPVIRKTNANTSIPGNNQELLTLQIGPLLKLKQRLDDIGIKAYDSELIEAACRSFKRFACDLTEIREIVASIGVRISDLFKVIRSQKEVIGRDKAYDIVHSAAYLGICDPILEVALKKFPNPQKKSPTEVRKDLDLLIKLARNSNLRGANAENAFHSLICGYVQHCKDPSTMLDVLYAKAVNNSTDKRSIINEISEFADSMGAIYEQLPIQDSRDSRLTTLFFYSKPNQLLPEYLAARLSAAQNGIRPTVGSAEKQFSEIIVSSIESATRELLAVGKISIEPSCFLPADFGPYNVDFLVLGEDSSGKQQKFAWEINGKQHYCLADSRISRGADEFRRRVLLKNGIKTIDLSNSDLFQANLDGNIPELITSALKNCID